MPSGVGTILGVGNGFRSVSSVSSYLYNTNKAIIDIMTLPQFCWVNLITRRSPVSGGIESVLPTGELLWLWLYALYEPRSQLWTNDVIHIMLLHWRQMRTEPRPQVTCTDNFVNFAHVVFQICKQTDIHAHYNTSHPHQGRSNDGLSIVNVHQFKPLLFIFLCWIQNHFHVKSFQTRLVNSISFLDARWKLRFYQKHTTNKYVQIQQDSRTQ